MSLFSGRIFATDDTMKLAQQLGEFIGDLHREQQRQIDKLSQRVEAIEDEVAKLKAGPRMSLRQRLKERGIA